MIIDNGGIKWMACPAGGLVRFLNGSWFAYNTLSSNIPTNSLTSIIQDSVGNFYLGSYGKGLIKNVGFDYHNWNSQNSDMPDDVVYSVAIESDGIVWMGTDAHGVVRFDENLWASVAEKSGGKLVQIFPTIFSESIYIQASSQIIESITVFNAMGIQVKNIPVKITKEETFSLDLAGLSVGIYVISVNSPGAFYSKKVLKID